MGRTSMALSLQCRLRPCWVLLLVCTVATSAPSNVHVSDGVLDDISVDELQDPDMSGDMYHQDGDHMSKADVQQASQVFDVLFPTEHGEDRQRHEIPEGDHGHGAHGTVL